MGRVTAADLGRRLYIGIARGVQETCPIAPAHVIDWCNGAYTEKTIDSENFASAPGRTPEYYHFLLTSKWFKFTNFSFNRYL